MFEVPGKTGDSGLSGILGFILAITIFGIYYGFCRAYKVFLEKLRGYLCNGAIEHIETSEPTSNVELPKPSCRDLFTPSLTDENCIEQQKEEADKLVAVQARTQAEEPW